MARQWFCLYAAKLVRVTRVGCFGLPTRVNFGIVYLRKVVVDMSDLTPRHDNEPKENELNPKRIEPDRH
jgi:hypothetical protein